MKEFIQQRRASFYLKALSFSRKFFYNLSEPIQNIGASIPAQEILVQLCVIDGKLVLSQPESLKLKAMCEPLSGLKNGMYMVKLTSARDFIVHKVVKGMN